MELIESALLKIKGQYPVISNQHLWEVVQLDGSNGYSKSLAKLYPRDLTLSNINVKHNADSSSIVSLRDINLYNELLKQIGKAPVLFIRNLPIRQWFTVDSVSSSKILDEDSGIESWSYDFNLLDPISILKYITLANNKYVTIPSTPPKDYTLPADYLKFALGTGKEIKESEILQAMLDHTLVNGNYLNPTTPSSNDDIKFKGLKPTQVLPATNPIYSPAKTSWINTECGDLTTLEKMADMAYESPILGCMEGTLPVYKVYDSPNLNTLTGSISNRSMASYTAGYEHSTNQFIVGKTSTFPALILREYLNTSITPYKKMAVTDSDVPDGTSLATATLQITSLIKARLTRNDIKRFIDTQLTTQLKPWDTFILGDAIQIKIDDVQGFGVINLMVTEISETIEQDTIVYTLTLEELEDTYATI